MNNGFIVITEKETSVTISISLDLYKITKKMSLKFIHHLVKVVKTKGVILGFKCLVKVNLAFLTYYMQVWCYFATLIGSG